MARPWKLQAVQSRKDRRWYVTLCGGNGEVVMRSKGFKDVDTAQDLCRRVQTEEIAVLPDAVDRLIVQNILEHHEGVDQQWYARLTMDATELMWSEGYSRKDAARRACIRLGRATVVTLDPAPAT